MTSELFSSVYKEKSDHLFDDRIFSCPVPAFTHWSIFVPLSENPSVSRFAYGHMNRHSTIGSSREGVIFSTLIFVTPSILRLMAKISREPVKVISAITSAPR